MGGPLLEPEFLRRLEALRRQLVSAARSGASGDASSPRRGAGAEFREHRPYVVGDDPRRVDWMAFARTGEPVIKLFRMEEDRIVRLLLDGSASCDFGSPKKIDSAKRAAAALGYLALTGSERAELFVAREGVTSALAVSGRVHRGRRAFPALCRELEASKAYGKADLARAVEALVTRSARAGLLVILSDFFDSGPLTAALSRARAAGHDVILLQILDELELNPNLDGDYSLEDSETGSRIDVTADAAAITAYGARLAQLLEALSSWSRSHGAVYVRTTARDDLETTIRRILSRDID